MKTTTHGVIRATGRAVSINGKRSKICYVMPPAEIEVTPDSATIAAGGMLADCTAEELAAIAKWLGLKTKATKSASLIKAIQAEIEGAM